jgi:hypothetical protein
MLFRELDQDSTPLVKVAFVKLDRAFLMTKFDGAPPA